MPAKRTTRKLWDQDAALQRRSARASYDIARSTDENANLWKYVDSLSAAEANSPTVRKVIRERARYEVANNSYADGICDTLAADTIGAEVQLQLGDTDLADRVEVEFAAWARAVWLWSKLRLMRRAKVVDGEVFALLTTNRKVPHRIKLDVRPFECDLVESWYNARNENEIDGIRFDDEGNPTEYRVLDHHPGDHRTFLKERGGKWVKAQFIIHYFNREFRPGMVRGVSELVPALSLFGELRQFTKAMIQTATRQAEMSGVFQTDLPPEKVAADLADPLTTIQMQRNALISLPEGWSAKGFDPTQPAPGYDVFKREVITEIARCLSIPYNVAACDSSRYNYASGRLDHQTYDRSIDVERADVGLTILDRVYAAWLDEYAAVSGLARPDIETLRDHEWHFSGRGHVDPNKEASADESRLRNGTLTRARYWAKHGTDWKREDRQWIQEQIDREVAWNEARAAAGLPPAPMPGGIAAPVTERTPDDEEAEQN